MVNALTAALPGIAAVLFAAGAMGFLVLGGYNLGALYPKHLSVRKSAQSRAFDVMKYGAVFGAIGLAYLVFTGMLAEMLTLIAYTAVGLGIFAWGTLEGYSARMFDSGEQKALSLDGVAVMLKPGPRRKTAYGPIGRRFGAFALSGVMFLAGSPLASLLPLAGFAGYTAYAAYKSR